MKNMGMPTAVAEMDKLGEITADGSAGTLTFVAAQIPQHTYNHLLLVVNMRTTLTGGSPTQHCYVNPNGDTTAANYSFQEVRGIGATPAGVELIGLEGFAAVASPDDGAAAESGHGECIIYGYRQTTFHKPIMGTMGGRWSTATGGMGAVAQFSVWLSTAAITTLNVVAENNNFKAGSKFVLYGIR